MLKLLKDNLDKDSIPNKPGLYTLYNSRGTPIYTGHSRILRHRLQSYQQKDSYQEHPTKRALRSKAEYFSFRKMPLSQARALV